ncbi:DUF6390 family protein [Nocardia sp. NPDC088792]|uniref:DUF6390 family protein n=1 Tax=Nocardia sp. NPDC088792 TaxID=3364332 RepID=UPI0037FB1E87
MPGVRLSENAAGPRMFARYAYAPNALGYCGPPDATALQRGSPAEIRAAARRFTGAWPYLRVMSAMTGIADPLDPRLVESYWHGGGIGATLDPTAFTRELLAILGPAAGNYWTHLSIELAAEAAPNHCFHVFGIYPWSRLLGSRASVTALQILDSCRITAALVITRDGPDLLLRSRRLAWDGARLTLSPPEDRHLAIGSDDCPAADPQPGDVIALHWDQPVATLTPPQVVDLTASTSHQIEVTNQRLLRDS